MSATIDQRVVEMKFDNKQFESNIQTSMSSIDKLKKSLNMDGATKGLESVEKSAGKINLSPLSNAVETVNAKFSALEVMAVTALANITNSAVNAGKKIVSALTIDPVKSGFEEYETQINAIQTILANTSSKGTTLDQVNDALDELNHYADMTIYNFTEMTRNIGTFTAAGVDLDTSVSAIKGIANLAAVSGSTSQQASTAMYQLSQALAAGTVKLMDWNSVVNAGMGGEVFKNALMDTARVHGIAIDKLIEDEGSFRESLSTGWLSSEILTETLSKFTGDLTEAQLLEIGYTEEQTKAIMEMGVTANDAATKVKTFSQLFDTLKEAAQSGWTQTWEIIVGDFEEAKALLTEMSDTFSEIINSSANARNSMLEGWKELGGRTALIDAARNAFEGVLSIIKPVKEAFREIFPAISSQQLYNITVGLKNLTEKLKISDTTSENLKRTFKGLFAVLDIVKQAVVAVAKAIIPLFSRTGDLANSILENTASFGDWLVQLDETIKKTDVFNKVLGVVVNAVKTGVTVVTTVLGKVSSVIGEIVDAVANSEIVTSILDRIHTRMMEVGETAGSMKSAFEIAVEAMGNALANSKFFEAMQAIWDVITSIGAAVGKAMSALGKGLVEDLGNVNFDSVFDIINAGALTGIVVVIKKFLEGVADVADAASSIKESIVGILDGVRGCFEAYQTQLKAGTLLKIASAIAILTASLVVLSLIDSNKLASAIGAITALFAELMGTMAIFTKISGNIKKSAETVTLMLGLSVSLLILASAMKKVAELSWGEITRGLIGIAGMTAALTIAAKAISKDQKTIANGALNLIFLTTALKIMATACKDLSTLSLGQLAKGLAGVGVLLAELSLFLNKTEFSGKAITTATGILILSAALKVLASACSDFGAMDLGQMIQGLSAVAVLLAAIGVFVNNTGDTKKVISTGIAMIAIAAAMKIFASAVSDFGSMPLGTVTQGLIAMAVALVEITVALNFMPKNMISMGVGLIAVGAALLIVANALTVMGGMSAGEVATSLITLGVALAELAIALNVMNGTLAGSAALLVAAGAINVLTPALVTLGSMTVGEIAKSLITLAGAFAVIGVAGLVLTPLAPVILVLAAAFALMGASVLAIGAGLLTAGLGLQALAIGFTALASAGAAGATAFIATLTVIITGIAALIPQVVIQIAEGIVAFVEALAAGIPQIMAAVTTILESIIQTIVNIVPQLVEAVWTLLDSTLQTIAEHTPSIVQSVFDILIACLQGIADNISMVVQTAIDIVINFIDGIAQKIPDVIQAGFDLLLSFINGITDAINNNTPLLIEAMKNLFMALLNAAIMILTGGVVSIKDLGSKIMNSGLIQGIKDKISSLKSTVTDVVNKAKQAIKDKLNDFKNVGKDLMEGFKNGISEKASAIADAAKSAAQSALNAAKNLLGIHSPSRVFAEIGRYVDEGFAKGIKAYSDGVADATADMGKDAIDAMSSTLSKIADAVNSDIDVEPTITPVMDLSNIQNGANQLFKMMDSVNGYSLSGSMNIANQVGTSFNKEHNKVDESTRVFDKVSEAISGINGGNTFDNVFNINGTNAKEIAEEVSNIIQKQVERRSASWA